MLHKTCVRFITYTIFLKLKYPKKNHEEHYLCLLLCQFTQYLSQHHNIGIAERIYAIMSIICETVVCNTGGGDNIFTICKIKIILHPLYTFKKKKRGHQLFFINCWRVRG